MKYRKKPVVIEARRLQDPETPEGIAKWCGGLVEYKPHTGGGPSCHIIIPTLGGDMKAERGDYIIKGVAGEFYPCKPDIFEQTYEKVGDK